MNNYNQQEFSDYTVINSQQVSGTGVVAKKFIANVFAWMFVALGVSALFAVLFTYDASLRSLMYQEIERNGVQGMSMTGLGMFISFAPIIFVLIMSFAFQRLSAPLLTLFFLLYATTMGMSLSVLLFVYTTSSVIGCFGAASVMFGIMAVMGYTTEKDLTSMGRLLMMGLIGIIVASLINMFMHSSGMSWLISIVGVAVFTGLTAYDTQKIKRIGAGLEFAGTSANDTKKLALMGALNLYLDFINLFIMLMQLFGSRRD
jgi:hypothetical protein